MCIYYFLQNFKFKTIGPEPNTAPFQSLLLKKCYSCLHLHRCFLCVIAIWINKTKKTYGLSPIGTLFFLIVSGKTISWVIGHTTLPPFLKLVNEIFVYTWHHAILFFFPNKLHISTTGPKRLYRPNIIQQKSARLRLYRPPNLAHKASLPTACLDH